MFHYNCLHKSKLSKSKVKNMTRIEQNIPLPAPKTLFCRLHTRMSSRAAQYGCPGPPACKNFGSNRNVGIYIDFSDF